MINNKYQRTNSNIEALRSHTAWINSDHTWRTVEDSDSIDRFAFSHDNCNGPQCSVCDYRACWHCEDQPEYTCKEWETRKAQIRTLPSLTPTLTVSSDDDSVTTHFRGVYEEVDGVLNLEIEVNRQCVVLRAVDDAGVVHRITTLTYNELWELMA